MYPAQDRSRQDITKYIGVFFHTKKSQMFWELDLVIKQSFYVIIAQAQSLHNFDNYHVAHGTTNLADVVYLDSFQIWDFELTEKEVQDLYENGISFFFTKIVGL